MLLNDHSQDILPRLLTFGDAVSMGRSLESRLPFLDYRLARYAGGDTASAGLIFSWISIEIWFRVFIDGEGTAACRP